MSEGVMGGKIVVVVVVVEEIREGVEKKDGGRSDETNAGNTKGEE